MAIDAGTGRLRPPAFFPRADAAILTPINSRSPPPATRPHTVGPIFDAENVDKLLEPWSLEAESCLYPEKDDPYAPSSIPCENTKASWAFAAGRYLRPCLAKNERLRLSMLWYYTRGILDDAELLSGIQEKVHLAQESTEWEYAVIGLGDLHTYVRLATVGLQLGILPRGETLCAHTITQPPGSVFHLPKLMGDWRFQQCPYVESGGLKAYAGVPLRLQHESGETVGLGSLCVASATGQEPLTKTQQQTLAHLGDWVVSDIVQSARARRQRDRRRMLELISVVKATPDDATSEESVMDILRIAYPAATISLKPCQNDQIKVEGRDPIPLLDLENGLWEDDAFLDEIIANANSQDLPATRVVRVIAASCGSVAGQSLLTVASKDYRFVFDDIDLWFVQTCASLVSQIWNRRLLAEVMSAKETFLRGVSHQLRTPIHGILGAAELLAEELKTKPAREGSEADAQLVSTLLSSVDPANGSPGKEETYMYLDTIRTSGRDLISTVNNMITLNRWADVAMKERSYLTRTIDELETDLANETLKLFSGDSRYQATIFFNHGSFSSDGDSLRIDEDLFRDSLLPLITNAIQRTPQGTVTVTTSICLDSKQLTVAVEDTGCGIHPADQKRIFEPYEKVDEHSTGAGLGLTLASKFASLLHGSISLVSSQVNIGSHFQVIFNDIECSRNLASVPCKLESLPHKFFHHASAESDGGTCLYERFSKILISHAFVPSDKAEDSFIILDFLPDAEKRRAYQSKMPPGNVAICLLPASEEDEWYEQVVDGIIYVKGPFLTRTIVSALKKASEMTKALRDSFPSMNSLQQELLSPSIPVTNGPSSTGGVLGSPPFEEEVLPKVPLAKFKVSSSIMPLVRPSLPATLIVDDNAVNLRIMQMFCRKRGLPYFSAMDGQQAVDIFRCQQSLAATGQSTGIQLVLMDLQMPVCDGLEATRQIRELEEQNDWARSVLFIVTGQDDSNDRTAAASMGSDEFFVKPVGMKVLDYAVKRYIPGFNPL